MLIKNIEKDKLDRSILNILSKYINITDYKIFYFGSRVLGKGSDRSDIDIGILGQNSISSDCMSRIREDVENLPILYKIEIVDFAQVSKEFKEIALKHIEEIHDKA